MLTLALIISKIYVFIQTKKIQIDSILTFIEHFLGSLLSFGITYILASNKNLLLGINIVLLGRVVGSLGKASPRCLSDSFSVSTRADPYQERHSLPPPALSIKNTEKQLSQFVIETYLSCEMR